MSGRLVSRAERDRGRPSKTPQKRRQTEGSAELPPYEPPEFALNAEARRALAELSTNNAETREYEDQLKKSVALLTTSVRDINDRLVKRKDTLKKLQQRSHGRGETADTAGEGGGEADKRNERLRDEEEAFKRLRTEVPTLTEECDTAVREVIDQRVALEDGREAMKSTVKKVEAEIARAAAIIAAVEEDENDEDDAGEDEDEDMEDDDEDGRRARRRQRKKKGKRKQAPKPDIQGPLRILKEERREATNVYASKSLIQKYSRDNDYIGFKRMWWDAVHGEDGKPLPDASRWFSNNNNGAGGEEGDEEDEDEDLVIAEEHISINCPLSLVVMTQPYTSEKCKHTFDKPAIVAYLRGQSGGACVCPVAGCNERVSIQDFADDPVMLRRIKRQQAQQEKSDDDDNAEEQDEADEDGDVSMDAPEARQSIKAERARDRGRALLASVGVGGNADEEEEEESTMQEEEEEEEEEDDVDDEV